MFDERAWARDLVLCGAVAFLLGAPAFAAALVGTAGVLLYLDPRRGR